MKQRKKETESNRDRLRERARKIQREGKRQNINVFEENNFRIFLEHLSPKWPIWFMNISNVYHQWLKEFFYMIFDNLTSPPDKLNGCVDNLTVLPINIFNYFHCHSEKIQHEVTPWWNQRKKIKWGAIGGVGAGGKEGTNSKAQDTIIHLGPRGPPGFQDKTGKWHFPWVVLLDATVKIFLFLGAI